jgi:hypothetical protein
MTNYERTNTFSEVQINWGGGVVVVYFKITSRNLREETEESCEDISWPGLEMSNSRTEVTRVVSCSLPQSLQANAEKVYSPKNLPEWSTEN